MTYDEYGDPINFFCTPSVVGFSVESLIGQYDEFLQNYLLPVLKKIPGVTDDELASIKFYLFNSYANPAYACSRALLSQDDNNLRFSYDLSFLAHSVSPAYTQFVTHDESQNLLNSLREQINKDFEDKIRTILQHEIQSDKTNHELLELIFKEKSSGDVNSTKFSEESPLL